MTKSEKVQIDSLSIRCYSNKDIALIMRMPENTIKSYLYRHEKSDIVNPCLWCGEDVKQIPGRKEKKFCSDDCRAKWWLEHAHMLEHQKSYEHTCEFCGKKFVLHRKRDRKYCSRECYIKARFGGAVQ